MSEQENIAVVQQAYNNFKTGNIPALLALFSDDIEWELPKVENVPFTGKRTGLTAVGEFFDLVGANQDVLEFDPLESIAQGDKVVSLGHYEWRVKATGREFASDFAHVFTIRGGKVVAFKEYFDSAVVAAAYQKAMSAISDQLI
jgi:ketosteroid isomerase-like protein